MKKIKITLLPLAAMPRGPKSLKIIFVLVIFLTLKQKNELTKRENTEYSEYRKVPK